MARGALVGPIGRLDSNLDNFQFRVNFGSQRVALSSP